MMMRTKRESDTSTVNLTDATNGSKEAGRKKVSALDTGVALVTVDIAMVVLAFLLSYYLRFVSDLIPYEEIHSLYDYQASIILQALIVPAVFMANGLYQPRRSISWLDHFYAIFSGVAVGTALTMLVGGFISGQPSRLMVGLVWLLTVVLVFGGRLAVHGVVVALRMRGIGKSQVLIVGTGETARLVLERIRRSPRMGYWPVGFLADASDPDTALDLPVLGTLADIGRVVREHRIDDVIVAIPSLSAQRLLEIVSQCASERVNIKVFPDLFQMMTSGVNIGDLNGMPLISVNDVALKGWNLTLKRGLDLSVSAAGLTVLAPLLIAIAALIKLTSPGAPVLYCQERVGLDGNPFQVIKFRTMRPDAEEESGPVWTTSEDPRRTRLGTLLRRYSLDELPQLMNVFIGEMSLVGPRPERPYFVEQFRETIPRYFERHREKAGMTGWAQVNGLRGNTSIEERTAYDLWYVENWTLGLDIKILLRTLFVIIKSDNAY